jgi:TetR/AcrR family transcriptional repressor of nem operon
MAAPTRQRKLTRKGQATRQRIVEAAADLIYRHGVQNTNNELVRQTAGISGSQLSHYFPDKESLVKAVIAWRAEAMMGQHQDPPRGELDSTAALRDWARSYLDNEGSWEGGCSFGSLAAEIMKGDPALHDEVSAGFERWKGQFLRGLTAMRDAGELNATADVEELAYVLMAAFQGGMLLAQAAHDVTPLRIALNNALRQVSEAASAG